jgi:hypothetical protein
MPRKRTNKNHYFTKDHEEAIVKYASTSCQNERKNLYKAWISPVFDEMVDKIVYTYKFTNLPNVDCLKEECKIWLTTILDKFDPERGSKAFSYFSAITKNWFIHKVKQNATQQKREVDFNELRNEFEHEALVVLNNYCETRETREFFSHLNREISSWSAINLKPNERKVLEAIKILFDTADDIEIFNKKAIYLYLREITGLNTKQVVNNLNKMRIRYRDFKGKWDRDEIK